MEKIVQIPPEIITVEKIVHVPEITTVQKIVQIPEVTTVEKIVHVPVILEKSVYTPSVPTRQEDDEFVHIASETQQLEEEEFLSPDDRTPVNIPRR